MRRADRLFQIVQALRGGRRVTASALAEALEVSKRTIYRDIADLQSTGVPVEGEAGFGYIMAEGFQLPPLMFTEAEIVALVAGARMMRIWGGLQMASAAEEALIKISAVLPESARAQAAAVQIHAITSTALDEKTRALIDQLEDAAERSHKLRLSYRDVEGRETERIVRPLALWFWGSVWTLTSWCETRADFRMFRIDRIASAQDAGPFKPEKGRSLKDFFASTKGQEPPPGFGPIDSTAPYP